MSAPSTPLFPEHEPQRVKVQIPLPLGGAYDYLVPAHLKPLLPGTFVRVPLGPRLLVGVVWEDPQGGEEETQLDLEKLKPITEAFDDPPLSLSTMAFVSWVARYTLSDRGNVLRLVMRSGKALEPLSPITAYTLSDTPPASLKRTPQREKVLALNSLAIPQRISDIAKAAHVSDAVVRGLVKSGALTAHTIEPDPAFSSPDPTLPGRPLSPDQQRAADQLKTRISKKEFSATLIDGVTGSGKTEVYLEAVAQALKDDPKAQVCILLPEIALTLPFLQRIEERFGAPAAHWHSDVSSRERRRVWRRVADGNVRLVVGARSALFLPYTSLRLIIVDEEHEAAYKQHDGVLYQARDMAVARGSLEGFPVILASATPSLETLANVDEGRYDVVSLPSRFGPARLPQTRIVDMRSNPPEKGEWLSPDSIREITATLARKEQALLYLNRRGYAPVTLCRKCGERMTAPHSDTWLVEHKYTNQLVCHHTGYTIPKPDHCPACGAHDSLTGCGPGVERIAEEASIKWPDARVEVFSSDTVTGPGAAKSLLKRMTAGEIDILVATQAAAKGHNFPHLTLVVAVDADLGLSGGDLRAAERTFQTLSQVAGRAGRADKPGRVLLQSYQPDHPVIASLAAFDRDGFAGAELDGRASLGFPPYGRLAAVILSGDDEAKLNEVAQKLVAAVPHAEGVEVWGPAPAPLYRLRGTYRIRFLVKVGRRISVQAVLSDWMARVKLPSSVRRTVDIDPYNFS